MCTLETGYSPKGTNVLVNILKNLKVINNKHIPDIYLKSSREQRLQLLAGLLDTDGSYSLIKNAFDFIAKPKILAEQVLFLARSVGLHATMQECQKYCWSHGVKKIGTYYRVYISGDAVIDIPTLLPRKQSKHKDRMVNPLHEGFTFEILPVDTYYGFTLSDDHLYLTDDFIIHHNSGKTSVLNKIVENLSKNNIPTIYQSLDMSDNLLYLRLMQKYTGWPVQDILETLQEDEKMKS